MQQSVSCFLYMAICNIPTAEAYFNALSIDLNLPWSNVIRYVLDTCGVVVGAHNSVLSRLLSLMRDIISLLR